ncbi:MAG: hypothetical protein ACYS17_11065, partial [Planctomycetota bacterium]
MENIVYRTRAYNDGYKIMINSGQNVSCSRWLITALTVGLMIWVGGYCSLFAQTNTEHNAE